MRHRGLAAVAAISAVVLLSVVCRSARTESASSSTGEMGLSPANLSTAVEVATDRQVKPEQVAVLGNDVGVIGGDWPMAGANPQRTSWVPQEVSGTLRPIWYRPIEPYIPPRVQVIAANGLLYVSTAKGLYALDAEDGAEAWVYPTELPLGHSPTVYDGVAYVGGLDARLHAIDALTGEGLWTFDGAEAGYQTNPLVVNGTVYVGNRDGALYAIGADGTPEEGQLVWKYETDGPILFSAAYKDATIYFASNDSHAYAVSADQGEEVWKSAKLPGAGFHSWWPVVYTDPQDQKDYVILAGSNNYRMYLDPAYGPDIQERERVDVYVENGIPTGQTIAPIGSDGTMDSTLVLEYLEQKPWRRTYLVLDADTGDEYTFSYQRRDGSTGTSYTPILWFGTHNGNRYPPVVGSDGVLYQPTHFVSDPYIARGGIVGWQIGASSVKVSPPRNAMDEPIAQAGGGNLIYWSRCNDRVGAAFDINTGASWVYFSYNLDDLIPGYNILYEGLHPDDYTRNTLFQGPDESVNGIYGQHGDQNPPVPYDGMVYMHRSNAILAFGEYTGSPAAWPVAQTVEGESWASPPGTDELKQRLVAQVETILDAGHLRPGYRSTGLWDNYTRDQGGDHLIDYWHYPSDTLYALSMALPHLPESVQQEVLDYMQSEYESYPPDQYTHVGWKEGAAREPFQLPDEVEDDRDNHPASVSGWGFDGWTWPPQMFYHLWKYAEVSDLAKEIYDATSGRLEPPPSDAYLLDYPYVHNAYIAGYLGFLNLERLAGYAESPDMASELDRLLALRATSFSKDTPFVGDDYEENKNTGRALSVSRNFMFLVPELGAYLRENALLRVERAVEEYSVVAPYWFVTSFESAHLEGINQHLYDQPALFQAKAWILDESREELVKYLDVPAFTVGDLSYIQNLVTAIEARPYLEKSVTRRIADLGDTITYTLSLYGSGGTLTLTDTVPINVGAPIIHQPQGTDVWPIYHGEDHTLTWTDTPTAGQAVRISYSVEIAATGPEALVNSVVLQDEDGRTSRTMLMVIANPYQSFLPIVFKGS